MRDRHPRLPVKLLLYCILRYVWRLRLQLAAGWWQQLLHRGLCRRLVYDVGPDEVRNSRAVAATAAHADTERAAASASVSAQPACMRR